MQKNRHEAEKTNVKKVNMQKNRHETDTHFKKDIIL